MEKNTLLILFFTILIFCKTYAQRCDLSVDFTQMQATDPGRYQNFMYWENYISAYLSQNNPTNRLVNPNGTIIIPVVVHVLHRGEAIGTGFNISMAQIQSAIDVLNEDYRKLNSDKVNTPLDFQSLASDYNIEFRLACMDPNGNPTNGVTRKYTTTNPFKAYYTNGNFDESKVGIKYEPTGSAAWPTDKYLNIWVCNIGWSILGYATLPQDRSIHPNDDGIVVKTTAFGRVGNVSYPYQLGRTTTHEVGHWLGLYHLKRDNNTDCSDDYVSDTPLEKTMHQSCTTYPETIGRCDLTDPSTMFMNFMEAVPDDCMNLFTLGQKNRSRGFFATVNGVPGPRASMLDNMFSIIQPANPIRCREIVNLFNPACIGTVTWSIVYGPATIVGGQGTNEVTIQSTGTGTILLRATAGNYFTEANINVNQNAVPVYFSTNEDGCSQLNLTATGGIFSSYNWNVISGNILFNGSTSATTTSPNISATGTNGNVTVTATNSCGSSSFASGIYQADSRQINGLYPEMTHNDQLSVTIEPTEFDTYYTWYVNGTIVKEGIVASFYCTCNYETPDPRQCGDNIVRVEVQKSCGVTFVDEQHFWWMCGYGTNLEAYPNPAENNVTVRLNDTNKDAKVKLKEIKQIKILDKLGNVKKILKYGKDNYSVLINIANLPTDIYVLEVSDGINKTTIQVTKTK